ncbi:MAG: START-like domain-containing protein [Parachlamydiaceae bacterium]|nr:START-like domain-containing protein [Parachlamydiaceae bacterium]
MSNKKKVSSVKKSKPKKNSKSDKKAIKKVVAKKAANKPAPKKNSAKPAPKKSNIKIVSKKINKTAKKVVTKAKAVAKKVVKPAKKVVTKKQIVTKKPILKKIEPKKAAVKVIPKKIEVKKIEIKKEKPVKEPIKQNPVVLKKEIPVKEEKIAETLKKKEYNGTEVLAITNTIPKKEKVEISLSKIASISSSITNPVKKTDSYAIKPEKEPNGKFELEFIIHASADMLYEFLSTPSGLSEWFCDDVNIRNGIYTFIWDGQMQQARLLKTVDVLLVRFQWVDKNDGSYFEFRIQRDDLTNDISLIITDFADTNSERESSKLLWASQVEKLMHVIGSIF